MNNIKGLLFDIDDTLYNYKIHHGLGMRKLSEYCEKAFGWEASFVERRYNESMSEQYALLGKNNAAIHNRFIRFQNILEQEHKPLVPHVLEMYNAYWGSLIDSMNVEPGALELCDKARAGGLSVGIATDMTVLIQYHKLNKLGMLSRIDYFVTSEEAGVEKPDEGLFKLCAKKAGLDPSEMIMFGDNWNKDIIGALRSGMYACWYSTGKEKEIFEEKIELPEFKEAYEEGRLIYCDNYSEIEVLLNL